MREFYTNSFELHRGKSSNMVSVMPWSLIYAMYLTVFVTTMSQTDRLTLPARYTQSSDKRIVVVKQRVLKNIDSSSVRYFTYTNKIAYVIIGANGR